MSKCHYVKDPENGDMVLIPGCMSVAVHGSIDFCVCSPYIIPETKEKLKERIFKLESENEQLKKQLNENKSEFIKKNG